MVAGFLASLFCLASLSGCFGEDIDSGIREGDVTITPKVWIGGEFLKQLLLLQSRTSRRLFLI